MNETITINIDVLLGVAVGLPKPKTRPNLEGILVEVVRGEIFLSATDGHMLITHKSDIEADDCSFVIPQSVLPTKKLKGFDLFCVSAEEDGRVTGTYGNTATTGRFEHQFVDWRRVVPETISGETAQFNPDLLVRAKKSKAFASGQKRGCPCHWAQWPATGSSRWFRGFYYLGDAHANRKPSGIYSSGI